MKVLAVSLLRLGDFFQQVPWLQRLAEKNEVHVLLNESLRDASLLFPEMKYHFFPRGHLQDLLTNANCNLLSSFKELKRICLELNHEDFDEIQNWTHNFLSARLIDLLTAKSKKGLYFQSNQVAGVTLPVTYLNDNWGPSRSPSFHWMDVVQLTLGNPRATQMTGDFHREGPVYLQVFTSDAKKNWSASNWLKLAGNLRESGEDVRILCAPSEVGQLQAEFFGFRTEVLNLSELHAALLKAKLLVSGDTSVAHLAVLARTPILGLFLGSADPYKTGPQQTGAVLLWPQAPCSPCRHSQSCSESSHVCGEMLNAEYVTQEVIRMIGHGPKAIKRGSVRSLTVMPGLNGRYLLAENEAPSEQGWAQLVWEFYLNRDHEQVVAPYGSAARLVTASVGSRHRLLEWQRSMSARVTKTEEILEDLSFLIWNDLKSLSIGSYGSLSDTQIRFKVQSLRSLWPKSDFFTRLSESAAASDEGQFVKVKSRKEALREAAELVLIQKNILRKIEQECNERGTEYGSRA